MKWPACGERSAELTPRLRQTTYPSTPYGRSGSTRCVLSKYKKVEWPATSKE